MHWFIECDNVLSNASCYSKAQMADKKARTLYLSVMFI